MKNLLCAIGVFAMIGAGLVVGTTTAAAAPYGITPVEAQRAAVAGTPDYYSPRDGVYFNNPYGTYYDKYPIINEVSRTIDSVPRGSKIRMAVYSFTREDTAAKVIAAYKRGVAIQILVDSHSKEYPGTQQLMKVLGTNKKKASFITWCKQSCMSSQESLMHAKLYLFTRAGDTSLVSMVGSGNISTSPTSQAWNNMVTMTNNKTLYDSNVRYFNDMLKDKSWSNYYRTTESSYYKEYFFPRTWSKDSDSMLTVLNGVDCKARPAPGYGDSRGRTVVKVGMYAWTYGRNNLAKKLVSLKSQGCNVEVTYSGERVDAAIIKTLLTRTTKGVIPVYNGRLKADYDTPYMHHKNVLINGVYYGNTANKAVYTGTANFTNNTQRECNEIMLRIGRNDFYDQFDANYNLIRDNYTKKVTTTKGAMHADGVQKLRLNSDAESDYQLFGD
ncbi:MAG TPA: phospholipase D-like domain-containing protein [Propionibacteriaceae bacterium]